MGIIYPEQVEYLEVEKMQITHEDEIEILNAIDKLYMLHYSGKDVLNEIEIKIQEYVEHVKKHFQDEEDLMIEYSYPNYGMHKVAHDTFLDELNFAIQNWKNSGKIEKIISFIHKTPEWLVMHVNSVDVPLSDYIINQK